MCILQCISSLFSACCRPSHKYDDDEEEYQEAEAALEEMEEAEEEEREVEEVEDLLEYYLQRAAATQSEAERLLDGARDLEESIGVSLSARRFEVTPCCNASKYMHDHPAAPSSITFQQGRFFAVSGKQKGCVQ